MTWQALHSRVNVLNRQLWELVRAKQDRVNKEEASGHFPLAEQGAKAQTTIAADRQCYIYLAAQFANFVAGAHNHAANLQGYAEQQEHHDTEYCTALREKLTAAQTEREHAEEQVKQALLQLEQAYKTEKAIEQATQNHTDSVDTRTQQLKLDLEELTRRAEDATRVQRACEKSKALLDSSLGAFPNDMHQL